jgi:diacylglycerol kinase family enzyme
MRVERVLLLLNRASGTGQGAERIARMEQTMASALPAEIERATKIVDDHPAASAAATEFLNASQTPGVLIVGGGGGTLRAAIEGICRHNDPLPGANRIRLVSLRLGSGNVVAKKFGIVLDPEEAIRQMAQVLEQDITAPGCVIRCDVQEISHYAVTMAGLGQFGRVPGDLQRWHRRMGKFRASIARWIPLEKWNNLEYLSAMLIRTLFPLATEKVEVLFGAQKHHFKLFSGVCLNFKVPFIPFDPQISIEDPVISLHLMPLYKWSALHFRIESGQYAELRFPDREKIEFFLYEDPESCNGWMKLSMAGTIAFVPGRDYLNAKDAKDARKQ